MAAGIVGSIIGVWSVVWWVAVPVALFFIFSDLWLSYVRAKFLRGMSWTLLEVRIPKENLRTPKAMEQIFVIAHSIQARPFKFKDKYWKGKVAEWMSFEIVGYTGGIHFFIRLPSTYRNLMEAAIYAQYPNAEVRESEDYTEIVPSVIPNESLDMFGMHFILAREDGYPIKMYEYFEASEEEQRLDPIASLAEVMSRLKEGEMIWLQFLVRPVGDEWKKKAEELIGELSGKAKPKKPNFIEGLINGLAVFAKNLAHAPVVHPEWPEAEEKKDAPASVSGSKGEAIKAIEQKIAKLGFETNIRFVFIDNLDRFSRGNIAAVSGTFRQYNTQNLNAFKGDAATEGKGIFKRRKELLKKREMFEAYKDRAMEEKVFILNTEELATVYHFPGAPVFAPMLKPIESKRGAPPPDLPIE